MFRFRKAIERPDWAPRQLIQLDISYTATTQEVDRDTGEVTGGVGDVAAHVAWIFTDLGRDASCDLVANATRRLTEEQGFMAELHQWCLEDFAQRTVDGL